MRCRLIGKPGSVPEAWATKIAHADGLLFPADRRLRFGGTYWWVATDGDRIAAYAAAKIVGQSVHLSRCGVLPGYRGRGLQRLLIRRRVAYFRRRGYFRFCTYVHAANPASANNLIRSGFRLSRRQHPPFLSFTKTW